MVNCLWAILCEQSIINEETGNISLIEVIDELEIPHPPESKEVLILNFDFELVTFWQKNADDQENEYIFRLSIIAPSGKVLLQGEQVVTFNGSAKSFLKLKFAGIPITAEGSYGFRIELPKNDKTEWENIKVVSLQVNYEKLEGESDNST